MSKIKKAGLIVSCLLLSGCMENNRDKLLFGCGIVGGIATGALIGNRQDVFIDAKVNGPVKIQRA